LPAGSPAGHSSQGAVIMKLSSILGSSSLRAASIGFFLLGNATSSFAADAAKEITTAAQHAGYAGDATVLQTAYTHLHHVINCLVGPSGDGFDAKEANPCASMGGGAIPDSSDAATKMALSSAVTKAKAGLASKDLTAAQADAKTVQQMLQQVK
jgi:hypothetical protein